MHKPYASQKKTFKRQKIVPWFIFSSHPNNCSKNKYSTEDLSLLLQITLYAIAALTISNKNGCTKSYFTRLFYANESNVCHIVESVTGNKLPLEGTGMKLSHIENSQISGGSLKFSKEDYQSIIS